jgi:hypothetical protein
MTKQHFVALAAAIASAITTADLDDQQAATVISKVATACAASNPRFDRARFEKACWPAK